MSGGPRIAVVWRGDAEAERVGLASNERLRPVCEALEARGAAVDTVVYRDEVAPSARSRLLAAEGVLVWVDPIGGGEDRVVLDRLLREVSDSGVWVSAHPDVIALIGTKEVLCRTRELGWGSDTVLYADLDAFHREFPARLARDGVRVLKPLRGNGGLGVWRVELVDPGGRPTPDARVLAQHAVNRDTSGEEVALSDLMDQFAGSGAIVDQAYQPRIAEGLVRVYLVVDEVVGFALQTADSIIAAGGDAHRVMGIPSAKTMVPSDDPRFVQLRSKVQSDWVPEMRRVLALDSERLPVLWDADFIRGPLTPTGDDSYVLCEINASCVTPFPPAVPDTLARVAVARVETLSRRRC